MGVTNKTPQFLKMNPLGKGKIEQWIDFATTEIDANTGQWLYPRLGYQVYLPPAEEAAISALKKALGALNTHLASRTFLVGDTVVLADVIFTYKYAFGKMLVIGSEPPFKVKGLWLFSMWKEVDINDEGQKVHVNKMIQDAELFKGEALLLDAKCFKQTVGMLPA
ncbi:OLC1v1012795C1 [Oldenlandia corymbosa var. corymbosa]|uniref:OLC1v1012795C1 n=1 Tax=Oldenlandia corymbosa var. corymbosa TaxID=529605 RepID=A0AAV1DWZ4_OLDCO|nr:OLC1v1012795C1 [Oldenlandia corymbosa var. corymbosa]